MITFPCAKINLGLNVVEKRKDGYHNLETVFYRVPIHDVLEIFEMDNGFPSPYPCDLKVSNINIEGDEQKNLVVKAYELLKKDFGITTRFHIHLFKGIPTQAGMGGGSSDGAYMARLLNKSLYLGLTVWQMRELVAKLGADCPFFVDDTVAARAEGIGEILQPIDLDLSPYYIAIVRPNIPVSTREAFSLVKPTPTSRKCWDVVKLPVEQWNGLLVNDFEKSVFAIHPQLGAVKKRLYDMGASYAAMSGSGSAIFGLFKDKVDISEFKKEGTYTFFGKLENQNIDNEKD